MNLKKLIRQKFRESVFERDNNQCVICNSKEDLDAHHITDRNLMPNGGYVLENGITLCSTCHLKAEQYHNSIIEIGWLPEDLYRLINSSKKLAEEKSKKVNLNHFN